MQINLLLSLAARPINLLHEFAILVDISAALKLSDQLDKSSASIGARWLTAASLAAHNYQLILFDRPPLHSTSGHHNQKMDHHKMLDCVTNSLRCDLDEYLDSLASQLVLADQANKDGQVEQQLFVCLFVCLCWFNLH